MSKAVDVKGVDVMSKETLVGLLSCQKRPACQRSRCRSQPSHCRKAIMWLKNGENYANILELGTDS